MPAPKKLLSRLAVLDRAQGLVGPGDGILAAVSGGPDSVCLAHYLSRLAKRRRLRLILMHLHHGLRGKEADRDEAFVKRLAGRLGLPFMARRLAVSRLARSERKSLEAAGRKLRYRALAQAARRLKLNKVATGHHLDDQAETLLLHLLRGTRVKGLEGMPPKRRLTEAEGARGAKIELIRPLLVLSRAEVLGYLKAYGLPYRRDLSNRDPRFTRNWVRRRLLPMLTERNPSIRENLSALAADARRLAR